MRNTLFVESYDWTVCDVPGGAICDEVVCEVAENVIGAVSCRAVLLASVRSVSMSMSWCVCCISCDNVRACLDATVESTIPGVRRWVRGWKKEISGILGYFSSSIMLTEKL